MFLETLVQVVKGEAEYHTDSKFNHHHTNESKMHSIRYQPLIDSHSLLNLYKSRLVSILRSRHGQAALQQLQITSSGKGSCKDYFLKDNLPDLFNEYKLSFSFAIESSYCRPLLNTPRSTDKVEYDRSYIFRKYNDVGLAKIEAEVLSIYSACENNPSLRLFLFQRFHNQLASVLIYSDSSATEKKKSTYFFSFSVICTLSLLCGVR